MSEKIGILTNPLSRRNRKNRDRFAAYLNGIDDLLHVELTDFDALNAVLVEFEKQGVTLLVINGGDGTVSAVLTEIYEHGAFAKPPLLGVLPGGTSNTIAGDVGLRGDRTAAIMRLRELAGSVDGFGGKIRSRALIRVEHDPDMPAVIGMFLGTAAICDAIKLRRRLFPQTWLPDAIAGALTLLYVLGAVALGGKRANSILTASPIAIAFDGEEEDEHAYTIVIVSTLDRIFLGSSPFWGERERALRLTSIRSPAQGLVRHAARFLYGSDRSGLPHPCYRSINADKIVLQMHCSLNVDGEFIELVDGGTVTLSGENRADFVQC